MVVVVVVVAAMVGTVSTWPISAPDTEGKAAPEVVLLNECGASLTKNLDPTESLSVVFNVSLPADCLISLRVSVKDTGLAKYGLSASGNLQVSNDDCHSSSLLVHDNDDSDDDTDDSAEFCSSGPIQFRTVEDVMLFRFTQTDGTLQGATITIEPELVCGGVVTEDATTIGVNHHHFKAPYVCNWELLPGEGNMTRLTFEEFNLTRPKRKKCTNECLFFIPGNHQGRITHYCGKELFHKTEDLPGKEVMSLRVARGVTKFKCKVEFVPDTRK